MDEYIQVPQLKTDPSQRIKTRMLVISLGLGTATAAAAFWTIDKIWHDVVRDMNTVVKEDYFQQADKAFKTL